MFGDEEMDYEAIRNYRKQLMEECIRQNGIDLKPGVRELLAFLKEHHIQSAIATATDMERTERYLKQIGLYGEFDRIVSASMVKEGKPAPDIYLYACEACGCLPEECMAVEDSPNGVLSAYRAGCRVVMVPDQTQPDEELQKLLYAKADSLLEIQNFLI
jgi:DNA helicase-2/ATP-dependent DNA helicase PcrA